MALVWVTGFMGLYCIAAGLEGYLNRNLAWVERAGFLAAGVLLYVHAFWLNVIGAILMVIGIVLHRKAGVFFGQGVPVSGSRRVES